MQQAYQNFNAGKYKQALNNLTANQSNIDSYEPNLYICQYMSNRCQQSALNCLKKLYQLTQRKYKRQLNRNDPQTQYNIKLNIAILMILQGKRDSGLIILQEVYNHRNCFIQFIQTRIFLLLILNIFFKNPLAVLELHRYYLLKPTQSKNNNNHQWISVILHEHGKTFAVSKQQYCFMMNIYMNQVLIQLGAPVSSLSNEQDDQRLKQQLISKLKKRKNGINKYYETNIMMINRFIQAQKELHNRNYQKCLSLMNFVNIVEQYEQMPATKIITNILNAFATSNTGIVHYMYQKPSIALVYFSKAKSLLAKACTGVEDKQLHLVSLNYGNFIETITYNQALCLLNFKPKEAFQYFEVIRKNNQLSKSYKYWYRTAQAVLNYYHSQKKISEQRTHLLNIALNSLSNCLMCITKTQIPTQEEISNLARGTLLLQEDIEPIIMKLKNELMQFKHSAEMLLCYVSLCLQLYRKTISIGKKALEDKKLSTKNRVNIYCYLIEAESCLGNGKLATRQYMNLIENQIKSIKQECVKTLYQNKKEESIQSMDYQTLFYFKLFNMSIEERNIVDAVKYCELMQMKMPKCLKDFICDAVRYLNLYLNFDKKYMYPFSKVL